MKLTELIERLEELLMVHGEQEVYIDAIPDGLLEIDEIDHNEEQNGIVIWAV
jgi:hypothetical protein